MDDELIDPFWQISGEFGVAVTDQRSAGADYGLSGAVGECICAFEWKVGDGTCDRICSYVCGLSACGLPTTLATRTRGRRKVVASALRTPAGLGRARNPTSDAA